MNLNPSKFVLLTGAGFTKDFGGFLAHEMHDKLFNHPTLKTIEVVRKLLSNDFDYESVYSKVMSGDYDDDVKGAFGDAMFDVYKRMDDAVKDYCHNDRQSKGINWPAIKAGLLSICTHEQGKRGYHFTTNQDIFLERHTGRRSGIVPRIGGNQIGLGEVAPLESKHFIKLPNKDELEERKKQFDSSGDLQYIKLHGSLGWISSEENNSTMVFGKAKLADIEKEPVLNLYYHEIFKGVLFQGDCHLTVAGYGFGDKHINDVIVEAAQNHGLKLFVLTTSTPQRLKERLDAIDPILWGSGGYFTGTIKSLFPYGENPKGVLDYFAETLGTVNRYR